MNLPKSESGKWWALGYLLLALVVASPFIHEGGIGHGNAPAYLLATILTSPLSLLLILVSERLFTINAFHIVGWRYVLVLSEICAGALFNAAVIYFVVAFVHRRRRKGTPDW